ncbi:MAG: 4Fe-4S binding protein, partial [Burkholderiales bacterium]|nr:4Fe-4S binding protein [Burkholderiales bacterium]
LGDVVKTQQLHTVVAELCSGCDLCVPRCPVDCIDMRPYPAAWTRADADAARARLHRRRARLERDKAEREARLAEAALAKAGEAETRQAFIRAAMERARARRAAASGNR